MKLLNDRITFTFDNITGYSAGTYKYYLKRIVDNTSVTVFAGNFFYNGTDGQITFDVTDIVNSDTTIIKEDDFPVYDSDVWTKTIRNRIVDCYYLQIVWDAEQSEYMSSPNQWVSKVYSYRNKNISPYLNLTFFEPDNSYRLYDMSVLLQGFYKTSTVDTEGHIKLTPHYPMYSDSQDNNYNDCPFGLSLLVGNSVGQTIMSFEVEGVDYDEDVDYQRDFAIKPQGNSFTITSHAGEISYFGSGFEEATSDGKLSVSDTTHIIKIGIQNTLYARYPQGDASTGTYKYTYALINNSGGMSIDDASLKIHDINSSNLLYSSVSIPVANNVLYPSPTGGTAFEQKKVIDSGNRYTFKYKVAEFDICPKKYYLFWQDRYGSYQCQAFNDYANYSESFDRTEIKDYQNRRRNANVQVQSKWKLNSGWIPEELYPYYESIYTSPVLILFDSVRNARYTVMVTGDYEEKTYRNQKRLINMSLELQENKKVNMIY